MSGIVRLFMVVIILNVGALYAAYIQNERVTVNQPDGSKIELFTTGDEFFNYLHDANGNVVMQSFEDGFYYYAKQVGDEFLITNNRYGSQRASLRGIANRPTISDKALAARRASFEPKRATPAKREIDPYYLDGVWEGTYNQLVLFVRFADQDEFTTPRSSFEERFNSDKIPSLKEYYKQASYGKLTVNSHFLPQVSDKNKNLSFQWNRKRGYLLPYNRFTNSIGYKDELEGHTRKDSMVTAALAFVKDQLPVGVNFDSEGNGKFDNITAVVRGGLGEWSSPILWPHQRRHYGSKVEFNGFSGPYSMIFSPESRTDLTTNAHEFFHVLSGPDLYKEGTSFSTSVGGWDLMDKPNGVPHVLTYLKWKYTNKTWIKDIPEITTSGVYTLNRADLPTNNCYRIRTYKGESYSQSFILEFRKKGGKLDDGIPGDGLVIYRVDSTVEGNLFADNKDEVYVFRKGGGIYAGGSIDKSYFSKESGMTELSDFTNPNAFISAGKLVSYPSGLSIKNIGSSSGNTITFEVDYANVTDPNSARKPEFTVDPSNINASYTVGSVVKFHTNGYGYNQSKITSASFTINGVVVASTGYNGYSPYDQYATWNTAGFALGEHTVVATVRDQGGNSGSISFKINLTTMAESFESTFPPTGWSSVGFNQSIYVKSHGQSSAYARYDHVGDAILTSPLFQINAAGFLSFKWINNDIMAKSRAVTDSAFCEISEDDGVTFKRLATLVSTQKESSFTEENIDLSNYLGKNIRVRFIDRAVPSLEGIGLAIDDLKYVYLKDGQQNYFGEPLVGSSYSQSEIIPLKLFTNKVSSSINKVSFYLDNKLIGEDTTSPYTLDYAPTNLSDGSHEFKAEILEKNGTKSTAFVQVTIQGKGLLKVLDRSPNGWGWGPFINKHISYDKKTNTLLMPYRKLFEEEAYYSGNLTLKYGSYDNLETKTIIKNRVGQAGTRLFYTTSFDGYHVTLAPYSNSYDAGFDGVPTITVYDAVNNLLGDSIVMRSGSGATTLPNAYHPSGALTKDSNGQLRLLSCWVTSSDYHNLAIINGKSSNGKNWTFSNYENNYLKSITDYIEINPPQVAFGKNGFGIVMTRVQPLSKPSGYSYGYIYTENYGDNMVYNSGVEGKFFEIKPELIFSWIGKKSLGKSIDKYELGHNSDLLISDDGKIHFVVAVYGYNQETMRMVNITDENIPVSGIYDIIGTKNGSSFTWSASLISSKVGFGTRDDKVGSFEQNYALCRIGKAGNTLYATWLDRPHNSPQMLDLNNDNKFGNGLNHSFENDAYFSYSNDGGISWKHDPLYPNERVGLNLTGTSLITEGGFDISKEAVITNNKLELYSAYQIADQRLPAAYPIKFLADYRNTLYSRKFNIDLGSMRVLYSPVQDDKIAQSFELIGNYPNPFNPTTSIKYSLDKASSVKLTVYNIKGEFVTAIDRGYQTAGNHTMVFDGANLNSGLYIYRLSADNRNLTGKMLLVK